MQTEGDNKGDPTYSTRTAIARLIHVKPDNGTSHLLQRSTLLHKLIATGVDKVLLSCQAVGQGRS